MNDLEDRLRDALDRGIGVPPPRTLPSQTRRRVRRRRVGSVAGMAAAAVVAVALVAGAFTVLPHGGHGAPAAGSTSWPQVVLGDPKDAYVSPAEPHDVLGEKHVLSSGTVGGDAFSFVGWTSKGADSQGGNPAPCIEIAGPTPSGIPIQQGGVGGYCMPSLTTEREAKWPLFPSEVEIFMRTQEPGGSGVCGSCTDPGLHLPYVITGFVTDRVARLDLVLAGGSIRDVSVLRLPNAWNVQAFVLFPPSPYEVGSLHAYDAAGRLLATAPLCGPDDGHSSCDVAPTEQVAPLATH